MKKEMQMKPVLRELKGAELSEVKGGGDIIGYLRCVRDTMLGGGITSFVLGFTAWGLSRMAGIAVGCAD